jgi:hypothetical protein
MVDRFAVRCKPQLSGSHRVPGPNVRHGLAGTRCVPYGICVDTSVLIVLPAAAFVGHPCSKSVD